jgi:D-amino-acid dehydrogenase
MQSVPSSAPAGQRVAVIGAGIVGMSCALFLQRDGHRVTVIDPREPGDGASFGNAGIIATCQVNPIAMPGIVRRVPRMLLDPHGPLILRWRYLPRIAPWLWQLARNTRPDRVARIAAALAALLEQADTAYDALLREAGAEALRRRTGWLKVYSSEAGFAATRAERALLQANGVRFDIIGADEIGQLEPGLARLFPRGVFFPDCGQVLNPKRLVLTLAAAFAARGGTLLRETVTGVDVEGERRAIVTERQHYPTDAIVLAAGAWSGPLARALGAPVPLDTERGYHFMFDTPARGLSRPVGWGEHYFGLIPMEHGIRMTSGVEFAGLDAPPNYRRITRLADVARTMLPGLPAEPASRWQGFRPSLPDSLPVLGPSRRYPGCFFAFGHQHLGVTLGAVSGRIVADLVAGRDPGLDLTPYAGERWV